MSLMQWLEDMITYLPSVPVINREFVKRDDRGIYHISAPALYEAPYYYYELQIKYDKKPFLKPQNVKIDGTAKPAI